MINFKWYKKNNIIYLKGTIYERSDFSDIFKNTSQQPVKIDMSGIERINSIGIRNWTDLLRNTNVLIEYINCSTVVFDQFVMHAGFVGKNSKVISFYARYYCEICKNQIDHLFYLRHFIAGTSKLPRFACKCGHQLKLDENEADYLKFINFLLT